MAIDIVGLGPGSPGLLTKHAEELLHGGRPVVLRTRRHPTVEALAASKTWADCDDLYQGGRSFDDVYRAIAERVAELGASAEPVVDVVARFRLELLAGRAQTMRDADLTASREQLAWVNRGGSDGIPRSVLPAEDAGVLRRSRFGTGVVEDRRAVVESGDGVIALGGRTDDRPGWLLTGEGLSALWLRATRDGLSVVPLSLPVEVEDVCREVRDVVLAGAFTPHLLVRIGWQAIGRSELPRTPRRPLSEVLRG